MQAWGGTCEDEATGSPTTIPEATPLMGVAHADDTGTRYVVTPITSMLTCLAQEQARDPGVSFEDAIQNAQKAILAICALEAAYLTLPANLTLGVTSPGPAAHYGALIAGYAELAFGLGIQAAGARGCGGARREGRELRRPRVPRHDRGRAVGQPRPQLPLATRPRGHRVGGLEPEQRVRPRFLGPPRPRDPRGGGHHDPEGAAHPGRVGRAQPARRRLAVRDQGVGLRPRPAGDRERRPRDGRHVRRQQHHRRDARALGARRVRREGHDRLRLLLLLEEGPTLLQRGRGAHGHRDRTAGGAALRRDAREDHGDEPHPGHAGFLRDQAGDRPRRHRPVTRSRSPRRSRTRRGRRICASRTAQG